MARLKSDFGQLTLGVTLAVFGLIVVLAMAGCSTILSGSSLMLLLPEGGAEWIRFPEPVDLPTAW